jgi:hypothetical protein
MMAGTNASSTDATPTTADHIQPTAAARAA